MVPQRQTHRSALAVRASLGVPIEDAILPGSAAEQLDFFCAQHSANQQVSVFLILRQFFLSEGFCFHGDLRAPFKNGKLSSARRLSLMLACS